MRRLIYSGGLEVGETSFPSVALLARLWLGRAVTTAFQERVFSSGSKVMSEDRTRTDIDRAEKQLMLKHNAVEVHDIVSLTTNNKGELP